MTSLEPIAPPAEQHITGLLDASLLLAAMTEGVTLSDENGVIVYSNPAEDAMFGYEAGELVGQHVSVQNAYPPEENARIVAEVIDRLKTDGLWEGEWENRRKDGSTFVTSSRITAVEIGGRRHWLCVQRDITAERAARAASEQQHLLARFSDAVRTLDNPVDKMRVAASLLGEKFAALRVGYAELDPDGEHNTAIDWCAPGVASVAGRHRMADFGSFMRDDWTAGRTVVVNDFATDPRTAGTRSETAHTALGIRAQLAVPLLRGGQLVSILFVHAGEPRHWRNEDVTLVQLLAERTQEAVDRARAHREARESSRRLDAILANTRMAVFLMDDRQQCVYANAAAETLTGYRFEQMQGRPLHDVIHNKRPDGSHYPLHECPIDRAFPERAQMSGQELFVAPDGSFYPVAFTASPVLDEGGKPVGTVIEARNIEGDLAAEAERRAIHNRLLEEGSTLEILNRNGQAVAAELDLERLVQMVTDAGVELTGAQFGAFFYSVQDEADDAMLLYALSGADRSKFEHFGLPRQTAIFHPTFAGEGVIRSPDILADPRYGKNAPHRGMPEGHLPVRSYLAVPVTLRSGEAIGGLFFGHPETGRFSERHERLMRGIAAQAAVALDNARLFRRAGRDLEKRRQAEERLRTLADTVPAFVWFGSAEGDIHYLNKRWYEFTGQTPDEALPHGWAGCLHPDDTAGTLEAWSASVASGTPYEMECRYRRHDGEYRWYIARAEAMRDDGGTITGWFGTSTDIHDRRRAEEHGRLLINELNHRVKNTLAIVQGLAQQMFRGGGGDRAAGEAFEGRLQALSGAHDILTRANWESASLGEIVAGATALFDPGGTRVSIAGCPTMLPPKTAVSFALAVHELATNAFKYGALSVPGGRVAIRWEVAGDRLRFVWREEGGPAVAAPQARGFGTRMIERALAAELGGSVRVEFAPSGVRCTVDAPVPGLVA